MHPEPTADMAQRERKALDRRRLLALVFIRMDDAHWLAYINSKAKAKDCPKVLNHFVSMFYEELELLYHEYLYFMLNILFAYASFVAIIIL